MNKMLNVTYALHELKKKHKAKKKKKHISLLSSSSNTKPLAMAALLFFSQTKQLPLHVVHSNLLKSSPKNQKSPKFSDQK